MNALHLATPVLELRSQAQGVLEGYASVFGGIDSFGDSVQAGAFSASLARHSAAGTAPAMLWSHQQSAPIGKWTDLGEDGRGLRVAGKLNLKTSAGQEAFEHLRAGDIGGLSIGVRVAPGGSEMRSDGVQVLRALDLAEVSVVSIPADGQARIIAVKSAQTVKPVTIRGLEDGLQELGYSRREARAVAAKGFSAIAEPDESEELIVALRSAATLFLKA